MKASDEPSQIVVYIGRILMIAITVGAPTWFFITLYDLLHQIISGADVVIFKRGGYYALGAGIGIGALTVAIFWELVAKKKLSNKSSKWVTKVTVAGLIIMFLLPPFAEYLTDNHLSEKGYSLCDVPTSSWPIYKNIFYTIDAKTCLAINNKKKKAWPSLYPKKDEPVFKHY